MGNAAAMNVIISSAVLKTHRSNAVQTARIKAAPMQGSNLWIKPQKPAILFPNKKSTKVLNGLIITSGQEFFEHYGMEFKDTGEFYKTGDNAGQPIRHVVINENHQLPTEIKKFFDESLITIIFLPS